jgi:two-component system OmpR family response regulator
LAKRIAIVEDEAAIRDNYAAAFRREGYAVDAYDARAPALEAFASRLPDLVVIDINLKDDVEGGFQLCRELRAVSSMRYPACAWAPTTTSRRTSASRT